MSRAIKYEGMKNKLNNKTERVKIISFSPGEQLKRTKEEVFHFKAYSLMAKSWSVRSDDIKYSQIYKIKSCKSADFNLILQLHINS